MIKPNLFLNGAQSTHFILFTYLKCSENYQSLPPILISKTNVNFPDDIKNNLLKNVFFKITRETAVCLYLAKGGQAGMYKYRYFTLGSQEFISAVWVVDFSMK